MTRLDMRELLDKLFDAHSGELPFLEHGDHLVTRAAIRAAIVEEAAVFAGHGVGPGVSVLLQVPPSYTQVEALLALWWLGAQVMLVDHRLKPAEVDTLQGLCRPRLLVRAGAAGRSVLGFQRRYELVTGRNPGGVAATTGHRLLQFSSGSTGLPKVIGRTPASLAAEIDRFTRIEGMPTSGERLLLLSSTAHSFGLIAGLLHSLAAGVSVVFADRLSATDLLTAARRHEVHAIFGTPFHYELLGTARNPPALPTLRAAVSGGEIMAQDVAERFTGRFGIGVGESYGTTETGVIAMDVSGGLRPSVGRVAPGVRLRIQHGELEVAMPDGSPYLRPPVGDGYVDGWMRTHDRAELAADGTVRLLGRGDSLVVIGGLKLDLTEVENALRTHPLVTEAVAVHAGVTEAYVCVDGDGISAGELLRWCRDRLADYKVPRVIQLLDALPHTANGKLVRQREVLLSFSENR